MRSKAKKPPAPPAFARSAAPKDLTPPAPPAPPAPPPGPEKKPGPEEPLTLQAAIEKIGKLEREVEDVKGRLARQEHNLRVARNTLTKLGGQITTALGE